MTTWPGRLAILIPWRTDGAHREQLHEYTQREWKKALAMLRGVDVYASVLHCDDGVDPFSVARIINRAVRVLPDEYELITVWGADHLPHVNALHDAWLRCVDGLAEAAPWCEIFADVGYLDEMSTSLILSGYETGVMSELGLQEVAPRAPGVLMYRRDTWDAIGGWDERFEGWGYGDCAQLGALETLYGHHPPVHNHRLYELWHPPTWRNRTDTNPNYRLYHQLYAPAQGRPERMRQIINDWKSNR